jgi:hypothetical protein
MQKEIQIYILEQQYTLKMLDCQGGWIEDEHFVGPRGGSERCAHHRSRTDEANNAATRIDWSVHACRCKGSLVTHP